MTEEIIELVNEQDEVIGVKPRSQINAKTDIYHSSALWVTNTKQQVLLAKRVMSKTIDPGKWGPAVAETVQAGEDRLHVMVRGAKEEIGIDAKAHAFTLGPKQMLHHPRRRIYQWYTVTIDQPLTYFTKQDEEVEALEWFDATQLEQRVVAEPTIFIEDMPAMVALLLSGEQ